MKILIAVIVMSLAYTMASAEMYQWIAEDGSVTFKDTPPPASRKRKKVKVYRDSDFAAAPQQQPAPESRKANNAPATAPAPAPPQKKRFSGTVEIYVTDWCGYCKQAQAYMKSRNIPFVAYNIEKDSGARQRHKELGGHGVPLIIIGSNKMSGFSENSLEYYLENSN